MKPSNLAMLCSKVLDIDDPQKNKYNYTIIISLRNLGVLIRGVSSLGGGNITSVLMIEVSLIQDVPYRGVLVLTVGVLIVGVSLSEPQDILYKGFHKTRVPIVVSEPPYFRMSGSTKPGGVSPE